MPQVPQVYVSAVLDADAGKVWAYLRDFGNLDDWLPGVTSCEIEDGVPAGPGAVRRAESAGGLFRERLLSLDDEDRTMIYEVLECPLPVRNYRATCRVAPVTEDGRAFVEWHATFDADDVGKMARVFAKGIYAPGLASLRERLG